MTFETPGDILCSIEIMTCVAIRVAIKMRSALYGQQKHDQIKMQQMMKNYYASTKTFFVVPVPSTEYKFVTVISGSKEKKGVNTTYIYVPYSDALLAPFHPTLAPLHQGSLIGMLLSGR